MDPADAPLTSQIRDRGLQRFVHDWDDLEALVIRVYKAAAWNESDRREFRYLRRRLRRAYLDWESALRPHWPDELSADPFRAILGLQEPDALVGNWAAMQTLPHAREAINGFLLGLREGPPPDLEHMQLSSNGVQLHVAQAGPPDGLPVVLLHGFPEFWYGWRHQIGPLAEAGYRVLVPDQRGYNRSEKPAGVAAYRPDLLVRDLLGLLDGLGLQRASLVGHDWGAVVAWWAAYAAPDRFDRMAILNVPHPRVFSRALSSSWRQRLRSWYIAAFQVPLLPELALRAFGAVGLKLMLARTSRRGTFSRQDLKRYRQAWLQPSAVRSMLHWYRAMARYPARISTRGLVQVPTLMIWGARDAAFGPELAQASIERCKRGKLVPIEHASHWVQHEAAERVNKLLLEFLTAG